jgi:hypothetical protein
MQFFLSFLIILSRLRAGWRILDKLKNIYFYKKLTSSIPLLCIEMHLKKYEVISDARIILAFSNGISNNSRKD